MSPIWHSLIFCLVETEEKKPRLLLACYFNIPDYSDVETLSTVHPDNMFITVGPDAKINPDNSIIKVRMNPKLNIRYLISQ